MLCEKVLFGTIFEYSNTTNSNTQNMNLNVVLIAQKFCMEHFCDNDYKADYYMTLMDTYLEAFEPEEKVMFLMEVKRIGKMMVDDALKQIENVALFQIPGVAARGF